MAKSLVQISPTILNALKKRIDELGLSLTEICRDANEKGRSISIHSLSKYLSHSDKNNLSEETIIWLCFRYQIYVSLFVGMPQIKDGKIKMDIPPYNEEKALEKLYKIFPKGESLEDIAVEIKKKITKKKKAK